ncbi:divalent-cation tolerance protein CutA [Actinokineospora pegani]|uniref:divalent-cation tolerance protein CutA n=1 Tax=Actinokineospora pegani TaxID=2654637 RepID=UPI0012E9BF1E|nr:divalent-cation tolerance protein CutA [Actinokineospora pegani]
MAADYYQVVTTTDSQDEADRLAAAIVEQRLGACVHVFPITSVYRWEGGVARDQEWRLAIKTPAGRLADLKGYIEADHSYDVPMVIATEIVDGSEGYLSWVADETR